MPIQPPRGLRSKPVSLAETGEDRERGKELPDGVVPPLDYLAYLPHPPFFAFTSGQFAMRSSMSILHVFISYMELNQRRISNDANSGIPGHHSPPNREHP